MFGAHDPESHAQDEATSVCRIDGTDEFGDCCLEDCKRRCDETPDCAVFPCEHLFDYRRVSCELRPWGAGMKMFDVTGRPDYPPENASKFCTLLATLRHNRQCFHF